MNTFLKLEKLVFKNKSIWMLPEDLIKINYVHTSLQLTPEL